jgi:hypothetical protein
MEDVANSYYEIFGEPEPVDEDDFEDTSRNRRASSDRQPRATSRRRNREEDYDNGRTSGVFGGNESGGRPSRREEDDERGPDMIDDIHQLQLKTGFF